MKIVYFNYLYDRFGISIGSTRKAEQLMQALSELGHDVRIFWMKHESTMSFIEQKKARSRIKKWLSRYLHDPKQLLSNLSYLIREWRILSKERPDLVISRLDPYLFSSLVLSKAKKIPLLIEADAPWRYELKTFVPEFRQMNRLARWIDNINLNTSDHAFCVSDEMRDYFIREGAHAEKLSVITNGANTRQFHPFVSNDHIVEKYGLVGKVVIGFIGSFHLWHGVENIMNLIRPLTERYEQVCFFLVGQGGQLKEELERFVQQEKLQTRVILTGYVDYEQMPAFIVSMHIVLALYPKLPFFYYSPVKIFEYLACGRAVLATRIGQIAEIIENGRNGLLCDPDRLEEVIHLLEKLIENPEMRQQLGDNARETIENRHDWIHKGQALSEICERVVISRNS